MDRVKFKLSIDTGNYSVNTGNHYKQKGITMNAKQLEVMKLSIHPTKKLFMLAMLERPEANRKRLAEFMNCDATHVSVVAKKLVDDGLVSIERVDDSVAIKYKVLI